RKKRHQKPFKFWIVPQEDRYAVERQCIGNGSPPFSADLPVVAPYRSGRQDPGKNKRQCSEADETGIEKILAGLEYQADEVVFQRVPDQMVLNHNFVRLILQPGKYFFDPRFVGLRTLPFVLPGILSAGAIRGYYRQVRAEGWGPVPYALTFYCIAILLWDYPEFERFLMPFLPLMAAGLWIEGRYLMKRIGLALRDGSVNAERPAAIFLSAAVVVIFSSISWFFWRG